MKQFAGYSITRNYRSVEISFYSRMTLSRTSTIKITPKTGLSRRQRYNEIAKHLVAAQLIGFAPSYNPSKSEPSK